MFRILQWVHSYTYDEINYLKVALSVVVHDFSGLFITFKIYSTYLLKH
jgi:hypothetical protein